MKLARPTFLGFLLMATFIFQAAFALDCEQQGKTGSSKEDFLPKAVLPFKGGDFQFVKIPKGKFLMGSSMGEIDEKPEHWVEISRPYYICIYEITQGQYEGLGYENRSQFKGDLKKPVHNVSWFDAITFCNRLSENFGFRPFFQVGSDSHMTMDFSADGFRLPTEAEWEYACRAGTVDDHFWGKAEGPNEFFLGEISQDNLTYLNSNPALARIVNLRGGDNTQGDDFCWDMVTSEHKLDPLFKEKMKNTANGYGPQPVGLLLPNRWGLYDVLGNVSEWCLDTYHFENDEILYSDKKLIDPFYWAPFQIIYCNDCKEFHSKYPRSQQTSFSLSSHDGIFPEPGAVLRGGSIFSERFDCRCASRNWVAIEGGRVSPETGFRIVKNIP